MSRVLSLLARESRERELAQCLTGVAKNSETILYTVLFTSNTVQYYSSILLSTREYLVLSRVF